MKFTVDELLKAGTHKWDKKDIDKTILHNMEDLCQKVNSLGYTPPMYANSCLRSIKDQQRINPKAMGSAHLYGAAIDISDKDGKLKTWLLKQPELLTYAGLWMENPDKTSGWIHLQLYAPKSMRRIFNP